MGDYRLVPKVGLTWPWESQLHNSHELNTSRLIAPKTASLIDTRMFLVLCRSQVSKLTHCTQKACRRKEYHMYSSSIPEGRVETELTLGIFKALLGYQRGGHLEHQQGVGDHPPAQIWQPDRYWRDTTQTPQSITYFLQYSTAGETRTGVSDPEIKDFWALLPGKAKLSLLCHVDTISACHQEFQTKT